MSKYKEYNIEKLSIQDVEAVAEEYLGFVKDPNIKELDFRLCNSYLTLNIEQYPETGKTEDTWRKIAKLMQEIESQEKYVYLWFRDDDIGKFTPSLKNFLDYFREQRLQVLLGVIPLEVDANCAVELQQYMEVFTVGQHGYSHIDYSVANNQISSEFPEDRDEDIVLKEIKLGQKKLERLFGEKYLNIFIPPWFEISEKTYKLLEKDMFNIFSISWQNKRVNKNTIEVNTQIDLIDWEKYYAFGGEKYVLLQLIKELEEIKKSKNQNNVIGILFHHERSDKETYNFISKFLKRMKPYENVKITNIHEAIEIIKLSK